MLDSHQSPNGWAPYKARPAAHAIRYLGFRTVRIPMNCGLERRRSPFHELGFCTAGSVMLSVSKGSTSSETVLVEAGDFFFVPAGTFHRLFNADYTEAAIVVAAAGWAEGCIDVLDSFAELPLWNSPTARRDIDADLTSVSEPAAVTGHDPEGHLVLFSDTRSDLLRAEATVRSTFDRCVVAREFGLPVGSVPSFEMGLTSPAVVRANSPSVCGIIKPS